MMYRKKILLLGLVFGVAKAEVPTREPDRLNGSYVLERQVLSPGGGLSVGGSYLLRGSVGQAVADLAAGQAYLLRSGFWGLRPEGAGDLIFEDDFE